MSWIPDPYFRIYLMSIHKDKHGSDSGIFDTEGRFIPSRFEDMWVKVSRESWDAHSLLLILHSVHRAAK